jgi:hypothetical protein
MHSIYIKGKLEQVTSQDAITIITNKLEDARYLKGVAADIRTLLLIIEELQEQLEANS